MDSFELNKILGAILGTLLFVMGLGFIAEAIYAPRAAGPGYDLPAPSQENPNGPTQPTAAVDIGTLLAKADPKAGEAAAKKCQTCHDFTEGGPNKTGPNLYGVVDRPIASHPGFDYSSDLKAHGNDKWTYENLNTWITAPKAFAANTKMSYSGDKDDQDRANVIAYLGTLSHNPVPYPAPAAPQTNEQPTSGQVVSGVSSAASSNADTSKPVDLAPAAPAAPAAPSASASAAPATSEPSSAAAAASSSAAQ
jgi:cytochrome c